MTLILVFGTSTAYGAWDIEGGWVQRLRGYLDQKQFDDSDLYYMIYNLSISGENSKGLVDRIEFEAKQRLRLKDEGEEVIILIAVGVNDCIYNNKTKKYDIPIENYAKNMEGAIKIAKKYADKVIFVSNKPIDQSRVDPIPWLTECSYREKDLLEYQNKAVELCKKYKIQFIDVYNQFKKISNYKRLLKDGVHPTSEGHEAIFNIVKDFMLKERILE